jgi:hypothetical protein
VDGQHVYSAFFSGNGVNGSLFVGQSYSNRSAWGTAKGDESQSICAVVSGRHFNAACCFDCAHALVPMLVPCLEK